MIQVRFGFDTVDEDANHFEGFYVDDALVQAASGPFCGNGLAAEGCGETCDDGNAQGGDGCSASCQLEGVTDRLRFAGTAQGGAIRITVSGVELVVSTHAGQSAAAVADAVAAAIEASSALQALGVSAASSLGDLFVLGGAINAAIGHRPRDRDPDRSGGDPRSRARKPDRTRARAGRPRRQYPAPSMGGPQLTHFDR